MIVYSDGTQSGAQSNAVNSIGINGCPSAIPICESIKASPSIRETTQLHPAEEMDDQNRWTCNARPVKAKEKIKTARNTHVRVSD